MTDVNEVAEKIYMIDNNLYSIPQRGSVYIINEEKKALVDSGPTTSAIAVLDGIKQIGLKPADIDYLIVTHIHLDHAGGAGFLMRQMPKARLLVHPRGLKHMVDPSRLVASVLEHQGKEGLRRDGEVVPIEESRVQSVNDGDTLELSDKQTLKFIDAPGHVPHQTCIYESRNGGIFAGDAVGSRVEGVEAVVPATPPPGFDLELYINTLDKLLKLDARKIYFGHFGASDRVKGDIEASKAMLGEWGDIVAESAAKGEIDKAAERIEAEVSIELEPIKKKLRPLYDYMTKVSIPLNAVGYVKYYQDRHGDKRRKFEGN